MCNDCWKELKGWCRSFTRTEIALAILEGILLILCVTFLVFLIIHLVICQGDVKQFVKPTPGAVTTTRAPVVTSCVTGTRLPPGVKCTWVPFEKTRATTRYYVEGESVTYPTTMMTSRAKLGFATGVESLAWDDHSDGEQSDAAYGAAVLALVKPAPASAPRNLTFGCILTSIGRRWSLTAASCVEAIEEVDSLDAFVMVERYGSARREISHAVDDVQLHPLYQGRNRSYDVAALRSEDPLSAPDPALRLPAPLDVALLTPGERLTILGFGPFRSMEPTRGLRAVNVYSLPVRQCVAEGEGGWATRHLRGGRPETAGKCGSSGAPLCAGVRYSRGTPCNYCAGTPLLRARTLLGLMAAAAAGAGGCAEACEPALYVNLAKIRDWLDMVLDLE